MGNEEIVQRLFRSFIPVIYSALKNCAIIRNVLNMYRLIPTLQKLLKTCRIARCQKR